MDFMAGAKKQKKQVNGMHRIDKRRVKKTFYGLTKSCSSCQSCQILSLRFILYQGLPLEQGHLAAVKRQLTAIFCSDNEAPRIAQSNGNTLDRIRPVSESDFFSEHFR